MVRKVGHRAAQRLDDLDLGRGIGHVIGPAHDVGDPHFHIIDGRCESIKDLPVALDQHRVTDGRCINGNIADDPVTPFDPLQIELEPPVSLPPFGAVRVFLGLGQVKGRAVINRRFAHVQLLLALEVKFGRRLKAFVQTAHLDQAFLGRSIAVKAQRLPFHPVPRDTQPAQIVLQTFDIFFLGPFRVGVVDPQNEGAAVLARDRIVEQGGAQVPDMDPAGGRRGKSGGGHGSSPVAQACLILGRLCPPGPVAAAARPAGRSG